MQAIIKILEEANIKLDYKFWSLTISNLSSSENFKLKAFLFYDQNALFVESLQAILIHVKHLLMTMAGFHLHYIINIVFLPVKHTLQVDMNVVNGSDFVRSTPY